MKVFNITDRKDEAADRLAFHGQRSVAFNVGGTLIKPGESADVKDRFRHEVEPFLRSGAACLEKTPEGYVSSAKKNDKPEKIREDMRAPEVPAPPMMDEPEKAKEGTRRQGR